MQTGARSGTGGSRLADGAVLHEHEILVDRQEVSSVALITSVSWTPGRFKNIRLRFLWHVNSTNNLVVRPNGISGTVYGWCVLTGYLTALIGYFQQVRNSITYMILGLLGGDVDIDAEF